MHDITRFRIWRLGRARLPQHPFPRRVAPIWQFSGTPRRSWARPRLKRDGVLGACDDAEAARTARLGPGRSRCAKVVVPRFRSAQEPHGCEFGRAQDTQLEDRIWTDVDALALPFAARAVDDGEPLAGDGPTPFAR